MESLFRKVALFLKIGQQDTFNVMSHWSAVISGRFFKGVANFL
jgi:hypothetical protein